MDDRYIILSLVCHSRDPTHTDDASKGFLQGQSWFNTVTKSYFICVHNVEQSAVWERLKFNLTHDEDYRVGFSKFNENTEPVIVNTGLKTSIDYISITPIDDTMGDLGDIEIDIINNTFSVSNTGRYTGRFCWFVVGADKQYYNLTLNCIGNGKIIDPINEIECSTRCEYKFEVGHVVGLQAVEDNVQFREWITWHDINPSTFTMDRDIAITAVFEDKKYTLTIEKTGNGYGFVYDDDDYVQCGVTCQGIFNPGDIVTLNAESEHGFEFGGWDNVDEQSDNQATVYMNQSKTVYANFYRDESHITIPSAGTASLSVSLNTEYGDGLVYSNDGYINCGGNCSHDYEIDSLIELYAEPQHGYKFSEWTGSISSSENPLPIVIKDNLDISATFIPKKYKVDVEIPYGGGFVMNGVDIHCSGYQYYDYGSDVILESMPHPTYQLKEWQINGETITDSSITITIDGPKTIKVVFERKRYDLTVEVIGPGQVFSPFSGVTCQPNDTCIYDYQHGDVVHLYAVEQHDEVYFVKWVFEYEEIDNEFLTFLINRNLQTQAIFYALYTLNVEINGDGSVTSNDDKIDCPDNCANEYIYEGGPYDEVQLFAHPSSGRVLYRWDGCDSVDENVCNVLIDSSKDIIANFVQRPDNVEYGYNCGGHSSHFYHSDIYRFVFPFDNAETLDNIGSMIDELRDMGACNSSTYFYLFGGRKSDENYDFIQRYQFGSSGNASHVSSLNSTKSCCASNNDFTYGYIYAGANRQGASYQMYSQVSRILFAMDSAGSEYIANVDEAKHTPVANNSSFYGYVCGGWVNDGNVKSTVERFNFPVQDGKSQINTYLNESMYDMAPINCSQYGYTCGGVYSPTTGNNVYYNNIERFQFPSQNGQCITIATLPETRRSASSNNASNYGYICAGRTDETVFGRFSKIERYEFSIDSGASAEHIANLASSRVRTASADGTDFVNLFI